ncbi:hypothetical protein G6F61_007543 [Rhizopus arrhizus]|nr:hypothetical protein G6F24_008365 [Rhizopus arrhizus]KAG1294497.1 hypothetical protein G6F66_005167 [Rhizopus arrhizus]KAG1376500.1 hypothetical protein G6F61_007543 [Rhizopus arrhizus]
MSSKQGCNSTASKKIRMTMACERCRSKKVKCDFAHPQCARCQQAKVECSYDGSATQIDLFNLLKINETVQSLQNRVQSIESDIKEVCNNTKYVANQVKMNQEADEKLQQQEQKHETSLPCQKNMQESLSSPQTNSQWTLSLTPQGLRIDTNIISLQNLYDVLSSGISHFEMHDNTMDSASSQSSSSTDTVTVLKKKPLWKSRLKTFPLYSSWEPSQPVQRRDKMNHNKPSKETLDEMIEIYDRCFLCLPCPDPALSIITRYQNGTLDPLLANAVFAWTARHAAIFHGLFPGRDPNEVSEPFFIKAKALVKERFTETSVDTMHSLLIMYIYAIGIPSENKRDVESEAYIYLGLAIRMCLDLKMNTESKSKDVHDQERNRRYFWALYFLETLGTIHSDRPFSLPTKAMTTVRWPSLMNHETGEKKYRVEFIIHRFKITCIFYDIVHKTAEEKPLLSHISAIDRELNAWYAQLPSYFKYELGDVNKRKWNTFSFREQGCIKLNFEYNFSLCQLYDLFFNKCPDEQSSTIEVLSRETCLKAANTMIELLDCWVQLKQDWCHFSLESLMMITAVYSNILSQPEDNERKIAKENLERMANVLMSSPVRHHKHVLSLVNHIKDTLHTQLDNSAPLLPTLPSQQPPSLSFIPPTTPIRQHPVFTDYLPSVTYSEDIHFSDFVYTPTLMDYSLFSSIPFQDTPSSSSHILPTTSYNTMQSVASSSSQPWPTTMDQAHYYQEFPNNDGSRFY